MRIRNRMAAIFACFVTSACGVKGTSGSALMGDDPDQIYLQIVDAQGSKARLAASAPKSYDAMRFCEGRVDCGQATGTPLTKSSANADRSFFEFPSVVDLSTGVTLTLVASNSADSAVQTKKRVVRIAARSGDGSSQDSYDWQKNIELVTIPAVNRACDLNRFKRFYCDVMQHVKSPYLGSGDTATDVHESMHFLLHENTRSGSKFIYWQDGKGAHFPEPRTLTRDIAAKILFKSGMYYNNYISSRPTQVLGENIVDEWRAYLTEEIYGIEVGNSEGMGAGGVEFLYYNAAMLQALSEKEPEYLTNKQGVAIFAMMAETAHEWTITRGVEKNFFNGPANQRAQNILALMRTDAAHAPLREALKKIYGAAWTLRVLGF